MKSIQITEHTIPHIINQLNNAAGHKKPYECRIVEHDSSLKGRQRALANIWYQTIASETGCTVGESESFCKHAFGLKLVCSGDKIHEGMIRNMLDGHDYEVKLKIIERYPEWFPILRANGGLNSVETGQYLTNIQRHYSEQGIILMSNKDEDLINCKEANR